MSNRHAPDDPTTTIDQRDRLPNCPFCGAPSGGFDPQWFVCGTDIGGETVEPTAACRLIADLRAELARVQAENERLRRIDQAVTEYRRKERQLLLLPGNAREENHLAAIRHLIRVHQAAGDELIRGKEEHDRLAAELARVQAAVLEACESTTNGSDSYRAGEEECAGRVRQALESGPVPQEPEQ